MRLNFTKMHGLGNDFVVIDAINQKVKPNADIIQRLSDRRFGIGCDQVLLVETPSEPEVDFSYRIFNYDGSEVENCGNGARCFARFVRHHKLTGAKDIVVSTLGGLMTLHALDDDQVRVDMGLPRLNPADIPFSAASYQPRYTINSSQGDQSIGAVSMGNPHAVLRCDDIQQAPVASLGAELEQHPSFPNRVNVGFMQVLNPDEINLRVFERGVGETLACGTGACAAVVSGQLQGLLSQTVNVNLPGGTLNIQWQGEGHSVMKTGPATLSFHGHITI